MTAKCTCLEIHGEDPDCELHGGPLKLAVFQTFGPPCDDYDPECETCQAWRALDGLTFGGGERRGEHHVIEHDGFAGTVIGHYQTLEGKPGVVMQLDGARVVHVYGTKWIEE